MTTGKLWISNYKKYGDHEKIYFSNQLANGSFELDTNTFKNFPDIVNVNTIYPENKNIIWIEFFRRTNSI